MKLSMQLLVLCTFVGSYISIANAAYPSLPEAVSNNAVTIVSTEKGKFLLSFTGLSQDKNYRGVHNKVWALNVSNSDLDLKSQWQPMKDVPFIAPLAGRLASIAVGIKDQAYVFGGYTVAKTHEEISTVDNYRFEIVSNTYQRIADMPVAVDDTAASAYKQRYIYLFGGWHNDGNVNLVQVYDTKTDSWAQASPMPSPAVFGQAVAMSANKIVLCDGVRIKANIGKRRSYQSSPVCLYGKVNPDNHLRISWQSLPHYSLATPTDNIKNKIKNENTGNAIAHYRMAATGIFAGSEGQAVFMAGSSNPYNYSGIGYNGNPSEPHNQQYTFDFNTMKWLSPLTLETPSMDHRGLICHNHQLFRIGGMIKHQKVSQQVLTSPLSTSQSCSL